MKSETETGTQTQTRLSTGIISIWDFIDLWGRRVPGTTGGILDLDLKNYKEIQSTAVTMKAFQDNP